MPDEECRKAFEINHLEFARHCASRTATGLNSFQHRLNVSRWAVIPANLDGRPMRTTRPRHWRLLLQPHHCLYMRGADRWRGHLICAYLCHTKSLIPSFFSQVMILFVLLWNETSLTAYFFRFSVSFAGQSKMLWNKKHLPSVAQAGRRCTVASGVAPRRVTMKLEYRSRMNHFWTQEFNLMTCSIDKLVSSTQIWSPLSDPHRSCIIWTCSLHDWMQHHLFASKRTRETRKNSVRATSRCVEYIVAHVYTNVYSIASGTCTLFAYVKTNFANDPSQSNLLFTMIVCS